MIHDKCIEKIDKIKKCNEDFKICLSTALSMNKKSFSKICKPKEIVDNMKNGMD